MYLLFQSKFCNLGYSLTAVDVNKDGHLDLVMGTPHYSQGNLTQNGMVAILQSKAMSKWSKYDTPPLQKKIYKKVFLVNKSFIRLTWLYEVCVVVLLHVITADFFVTRFGYNHPCRISDKEDIRGPGEWP